MVGYVNGYQADSAATHDVSSIGVTLPAKPADCSDLQTALLLWCGKIAKDATSARGLTTLQEACADMAARVSRLNSFRTSVIGTLLRCADDHLGDRHSAEAIDTIFLKVFPDQVADDCATNADLDATAVVIDTCSETMAEIARLAKLSSVEYDRERSGAAKRLGIRATTLDDEVKARRGSGTDPKGQGRPFELPEIEPWPEAVDGAALLLDVTAAIRQFVVMPDGAAEILALWAFIRIASIALCIRPDWRSRARKRDVEKPRCWMWPRVSWPGRSPPRMPRCQQSFGWSRWPGRLC